MSSQPSRLPTLIVEDAPDADDLAFLEERVVEETVAASGSDDDRDLAIIVRDLGGAVVAGVSGGSWGGCCELSVLWVDQSLRGRDIGSALILEAEAEASRRGCSHVVLMTHDVLTTGFYERLGYETVGVVDDYPKGSAARWFRKPLPG